MKFLGRRAAHALLLLLAVSFLTFALLELTPGDFFDGLRLNPQMSSQTIEALRSRSGAGQPLPVRYLHWLGDVLQGHLGFSLAYNSPVAPLLRQRAGNTLLLAGASVLFAWLIALPLGICSAATENEWPDRLCELFTSALLAVPDLLLFLALLLLAVRTGWFPTGGMTSPSMGADAGLWLQMKDIGAHLVLPAAGLALVTLPTLVRHVRSSMREALQAPFIRAARAYGIPRWRIVFRYALPVAANPLTTLFGFSVATMLSASALVEVVMSWPGLGPLLVESILSRDIYVVVGAVLFVSAFLIAGSLIADLLLFASDPRIRVE